MVLDKFHPGTRIEVEVAVKKSAFEKCLRKAKKIAKAAGHAAANPCPSGGRTNMWSRKFMASVEEMRNEMHALTCMKMGPIRSTRVALMLCKAVEIVGFVDEYDTAVGRISPEEEFTKEQEKWVRHFAQHFYVLVVQFQFLANY